ncbi:hypothetical protein ABW20_dc0107733 [Dactylellina cionopaga]|nr:hypothetical protein ABW20_dc0107733 [Dactylellina cionopaga]
MAGLWPTITKLKLVQQLRLKNREILHGSWRKAIIELGETILRQQRADRLVQFHRNDMTQEFQREAKNEGHQNWNSEDFIDWLLFELDSEMLIRPVQADIGRAMMDGTPDHNAVMQLNMGEGKSAVIVPAVVAALADTTRLVRSIVLKPLSKQMFQILVQRLGGLCDRRIYFLPFSRSLNLSTSDIKNIRNLYEYCMRNGSILLALPEHILSFKLMGLEKLIAKKTELSRPLIAAQKWLDENTRDVLDESDEILHIRYQLIYTMGQQQILEGGQDRWTIIQEVLDLVQENATQWAAEDHMAIELVPAKSPGYPSIRIIDKNKGEKLLIEMAKEICLDDIDRIPSISSKLKLLNMATRYQAFRFISVKDISTEEQRSLLASCKHFKMQLLVLRGLIASGVLLFVLREKRYRVDYGLDIKRSMLAVPYRAKDQPAVKAEFGHPDVVLLLTCLTYYYGGLDDLNLQSCFDLLLKANDPDLTYENWTNRHSEVPSNLSKLRGLNLLDDDQLETQIFPFFKYNKSVIDFFLSELVFPKEAKGFPHKLSTSGWDIAERKSHNTTGFSGTNDNRYLLPTSIKQLDLSKQIHTNSLVLTNILQDENQEVIKASRCGTKLKAKEMIGLVVGLRPKVQVLLDVGAQILELTNEQVAQEWLRQDQANGMEGVVFFGMEDQLQVMSKDGKIESFLSSALSKQLDRVLVYLDEAHTRGTDLKLPAKSRAAVTLGPNLAKDKFVQGCMRMRKLGDGHSLVFLASPDIYAQIQNDAGKSTNEPVKTDDILLWTMLESCRQIQHGFSIWADQGFQYLKRCMGWEYFSINEDTSHLENAIMEVESRPLVEMYGVMNDKRKADPRIVSSPDGQIICTRLEQFAVTNSNNVGVQEEQEREVDHETEEETNIERPESAKPRVHSLHNDVVLLARRGYFNAASSAFIPAFTIFKDTSSRSLLETGAWKSKVYVTGDFAQTVERKSTEDMDDFLRPVRWVVSSDGNFQIVCISPWEANKLVECFRDSHVSRLHAYAPKASRNMKTFEYFDICPIPTMPPTLLRNPTDAKTRLMMNIFAGQLFFEDIEYYRELCKFLGIYYDKIHGDSERGNDGWINNATKKMMGVDTDDSVSPFSRSPILFLQEITKMRRKGQGFLSTHLGYLLNSRTLQAKDFQR